MTADIVVGVRGMHCDSCERNIEFALLSVRGIEAVHADHKAMQIQITYDPTLSDESQIRAAIEDLGYSVVG